MAFCFILKSLYFTYSHLLSFVLSLVVILCHLLSFFYYSLWNRETATEGFLKNFTKFTGKHLCQSLFRHGAFKFVIKETPTQVSFCELYEIFKNNFFASDGFSKYQSLYMVVVAYCCSENILKISRSISASHCKFWQVTSCVKLKLGWIHITIKRRYHKTSEISSPVYISGELIPSL